MKYTGKLLTVVFGLLLSACSTTGHIEPLGSLEEKDRAAEKVSRSVDEKRRDNAEGAIRELVAFPFKAAGYVAVGLGAGAIYLYDLDRETSNNSYSTRSEADPGLFISGLGLVGAGMLLHKLGEHISE